MNELDQLIETSERLWKNLDDASQMSKKLNDDICMELERYSWSVYRMMNDLKEIKEYCGI